MTATEDFELTLFDRKEAIRRVIEVAGEDRFYISFSGGKDSTVLHYLIDEALPGNKIPRVFFNTGIEYRLLVDYVKALAEKDDRFVIVNNKTNIRKMLETEGYPFKSKEHSEFLNRYQTSGLSTKYVRRYLQGDEKHKSRYACPQVLKYQFTDDFKLLVSAKCCDRMKKDNGKEYSKQSGRSITITGVRSAEGGIRAQHKGCAVFKNHKLKKFNPLNPCTDAFVDWYIAKNNIRLCDLYYPPFSLTRTGCKGCPYSISIQQELEMMGKYLPNERKQCELLWKPVYDEYRRIGYRLKKVERGKLF